ncbi:cytochrome c biogenesis protein ResB [soil metagenome]
MTQTTAATDTRPRESGPRGSRLPEIPGPGETFARAWKALRRMSTALKLLLALTVAVILGTFVPQEPVIPTTVAEWRLGTSGPGEATAAAFDALGLFDVFGAWWFNALVVLLVTSLTGCLVPRIRAFVRTARRRPAAGHNLARLTHHVELRTPLPPGEALDRAETAVTRRRFRRRRIAADDAPGGAAQLATERGHAREGGSIAFHISFYVLVTGAMIGHTFGFTGQVNVVEGASFADTRIAYDLAQPGRWFPFAAHRGFVVELEDFSASYLETPSGTDPGAEAPGDLATGGALSTFMPTDFSSRVTISEGGEVVREEEVRVNDPLSHDGVSLYQVRFGLAPQIEVRTTDGTVLYTDSVILTEAGGFVWQGVAPVARTEVDRQVALELILLPDAGFNEQGLPVSRSPEPRNPRLAAVVWVGELGLERNRPPSEFQRDRGQQLPQPVILELGETAQVQGLPLEIEFTGLPYWSGFQVSQEPGRWVLLAGAGLMLIGLVPSLYAYRRRVWVEAHPDGEGSRVVLAGVALHRKGVFAEAFEGLADDVAHRLGAVEAPAPEPHLETTERKA